MTEEDFVSYKDISELKREFGGMMGNKDISPKDLNYSMHKLADTMSTMMEIFGAAAEQMKLEEKEYELEAKKHETIISKLDKIIDQNKTIAEGMVAIVEMVKEKYSDKEKESIFKSDSEEQIPKPKEEQNIFTKSQPEWGPAPEMPKMQPMPSQPLMMQAPSFAPQQDLNQMPPMEPSMPDFDFPEEPFPLTEESQKKKGLFGMFKK